MIYIYNTNAIRCTTYNIIYHIILPIIYNVLWYIVDIEYSLMMTLVIIQVLAKTLHSQAPKPLDNHYDYYVVTISVSLILSLCAESVFRGKDFVCSAQKYLIFHPHSFPYRHLAQGSILNNPLSKVWCFLFNEIIQTQRIVFQNCISAPAALPHLHPHLMRFLPQKFSNTFSPSEEIVKALNLIEANTNTKYK